jgi:quercetin dioxygenase-like cupin family protein
MGAIKKMPNKSEDKEPSITCLKESVAYQKGNIVSRLLLTKETGTLTAFAFDRGQGLSEHTAPFDATIYLMDGQAKITISGKPYFLKKGQMIIMPAHKPHSVLAVSRFKMLLIMIKS